MKESTDIAIRHTIQVSKKKKIERERKTCNKLNKKKRKKKKRRRRMKARNKWRRAQGGRGKPNDSFRVSCSIFNSTLSKTIVADPMSEIVALAARPRNG